MASKCIVIEDRFGDCHAAQLSDSEDIATAARKLASDLGIDDDSVNVFVSECSDPGAARLDKRARPFARVQLARAVISVRFMSLAGGFRALRTESFETTTAADEAVRAHAQSAGFSDVERVDGGDDVDSVRWTATTPGGRKGRNVAFGDFR